jgi:hypothetical protein
MLRCESACADAKCARLFILRTFVCETNIHTIRLYIHYKDTHMYVLYTCLRFATATQSVDKYVFRGCVSHMLRKHGTYIYTRLTNVTSVALRSKCVSHRLHRYIAKFTSVSCLLRSDQCSMYVCVVCLLLLTSATNECAHAGLRMLVASQNGDAHARLSRACIERSTSTSNGLNRK